MKPFLFLGPFMLISLATAAQSSSGYRLTQTFHIQSGGGWDYIAVNENKVYVSHGTQVNILDESTGDSVGIILNTTGVHGIAFIPSMGKGYTSNGRLNNVTVFDLKTNAVLKQIPAGTNPDAIFYDSFSKKIVTCNGRSNDLSVIDPANETVVATIPVGGKPETAVSGKAGKVFVNIEDKNAIAVVDISAGRVLATWPLSAEGPTGLAIDRKTNRLFAGCDGKLVVLDAVSGKVLQQLSIAGGCDGVAFDPVLKYIFASCGEGVLEIASEDDNGVCSRLRPVPSKKSARTITVDPANHKVFLPAADLSPAPAGERAPMVPGSFQVLVFGR